MLWKKKAMFNSFSPFVLIELRGFSVHWDRHYRNVSSGKSAHPTDFNKEGKEGALQGKITLRARNRKKSSHSVMFDGYYLKKLLVSSMSLWPEEKQCHHLGQQVSYVATTSILAYFSSLCSIDISWRLLSIIVQNHSQTGSNSLFKDPLGTSRGFNRNTQLWLIMPSNTLWSRVPIWYSLVLIFGTIQKLHQMPSLVMQRM